MLVGTGIAIRLAAYIHNRSLWVDEAMLAVNLLGRSYAGLLSRLDYRQVSPPLFLLASKFIHSAWPSLEYSLRLLPLICGCTSVYLVARIAFRLFRSPFALLPISLFSLGFAHIDWSTNFKHYALDEFSAVLLVWAAVAWPELSERKRQIAAALLPVLIGFSYTSSFILVGLVVAAALYAARHRGRAAFGALAVLILSIVLCASACWVFSIRYSLGHRALTFIWAESFPHSPFLPWLGRGLLGVFGSACAMPYGPALALALSIFGAIALARSKDWTLSVVGPVTLACWVIASLVRIYPLAKGRLSFFFAPIGVLLLAAGLQAAYASINDRAAKCLVAAIAISIAFIVLHGLAVEGSGLFVREEMRAVARAMQRRAEYDIPILVSAAANAPFRIYADSVLKRRALWMKDWSFPASEVYRFWLSAGKPKRLWLVMTGTDFSFKDRTIAEIGRYCRVVDSIQEGRSAAFLLEVLPVNEWPGAGQPKDRSEAVGVEG